MDQDVSRIPVPSEIPTAIDTSDIPKELLRTGAVESLISQNEDLMARIKVLIRRQSNLENQLAESEKTRLAATHRFEIINDQLAVYKEKDLNGSEKLKTLQSENQKFKTQVDMLEFRMTELYTSSQQKVRHLMDQIQSLGRGIKSVKKYRAKIKPLMRAFRKKMQTLANRNHELEIENHRLIEVQTELITERENIKLRHDEALRKARLEAEETVRLERMQLENNLIAERRNFTQLRQSSQNEITKYIHEINQLKHDFLRSIESERMLQSEMANVRESFAEKDQEIHTLKAQLDSLQIAWREAEVDNTTTKQKNQALQDLNQKLSINLQSLRKDFQTLKENSEIDRKNQQEKIHALKKRVELLKDNDLQPEMMTRVDSLIQEIQSGFTKTGTPTTAAAKDPKAFSLES